MAQQRFCLVNDNQCDENKNDQLICLADLHKKLNKSLFPKAYTQAQAIPYRADIEDETKIDLNKSFICACHFNQLFAQFDSNKHKRCYTCPSLPGLSPPSTKSLRQISRKYALRIHANFNLKHSYGEYICGSCRAGYDDYKYAYWSKRAVRFAELRKNRQCTIIDAQIMDEDDRYSRKSSSEEDSNADVDENFVIDNDKESTELLRKALDHLLDLFGNKNRTSVTKNYQELTGQIRLNHLSRSRSIIRSIMSVMAPNDVNQLEHDLFDHQSGKNCVKLDDHFLSVMQGISEAYSKAESWTTRREILSVVAPQINFKLIQSFLPGLTIGRFTAACKHAAEFGHAAQIDQSSAGLQRFGYDQVDHCIEFLTSEHVCTDLPFGERCLKQSNGDELFVPNTI